MVNMIDDSNKDKIPDETAQVQAVDLIKIKDSQTGETIILKKG